MSEETALPRPAQVTASAVMIMAGSVIIVMLAFTGVSELGSMGTREALEDALGRWPLNGFGWSYADAQSWLRTMLLAAGALAAAAGVMGVFVMRRDRSARWGLTLLALPLLVAGSVTGGFVVSLVVLASLMLWAQPSRDWFNGVRIPEGSVRRDSHAPTIGGGSRHSLAQSQAAGAQPGPMLPVADPGQRPSTVLGAAIITWIATTLIAMLTCIGLAALAANPDPVIAEMHRQNPDLGAGVSRDMLVASGLTAGAIIVLWCIAGAVFAIYAFRGASWARVALLASTTLASMVLFSFFTVAPYVAPFVVAGVAVIVLLMRPETRRWYVVRREANAPLL
ncbi:MAG: hypothetical protein WAW88_16595 [Nocardioides sp.]